MHKIENTDYYRLQNTDYDKVLKIQKKNTKTRKYRIFKITENSKCWISYYRKCNIHIVHNTEHTDNTKYGKYLIIL